MDPYTNGEVVEIIENEGLDYAVRHYCDADSIKDPETSALWAEAAGSLDRLVEHLERETGQRDFA